MHLVAESKGSAQVNVASNLSAQTITFSIFYQSGFIPADNASAEKRSHRISRQVEFCQNFRKIKSLTFVRGRSVGSSMPSCASKRFSSSVSTRFWKKKTGTRLTTRHEKKATSAARMSREDKMTDERKKKKNERETFATSLHQRKKAENAVHRNEHNKSVGTEHTHAVLLSTLLTK